MQSIIEPCISKVVNKPVKLCVGASQVPFVTNSYRFGDVSPEIKHLDKFKLCCFLNIVAYNVSFFFCFFLSILHTMKKRKLKTLLTLFMRKNMGRIGNSLPEDAGSMFSCFVGQEKPASTRLLKISSMSLP